MLTQKLPREAVLLGIQFLGKGEGPNILGTLCLILYSDTVSAVPFGIEFPCQRERVIKRTLFRTVPGTIDTID